MRNAKLDVILQDQLLMNMLRNRSLGTAKLNEVVLALLEHYQEEQVDPIIEDIGETKPDLQVLTEEEQRSIAETVDCPWPSCHAPKGTPCVPGRVFPQYPHTPRLELAQQQKGAIKSQVTTLVSLDKATNAELQIAADREGIGFLSSKMLHIVDSQVITVQERQLLEAAVRDRGFKSILVNLENRVNDRQAVTTGHNCYLAL
jgi:hypothetical protein